ncbi:type II toxin-antitoxin system RelE/ParE family toxin [Geofilum rhodophaeum]|uniref:type II toxin-antitoxin system RelE/ParE family toxin n=1 Tax=Geofilum rhodophaeum TaxID=1965019 RepID=UPI000B528F86|nr:type II toxin-antitoxin system RelE/ParE family toxin [Geofilum rhodophaeum]
MKTIKWTDAALNSYHENIDYLLREWAEKEALNFIDDVEVVLFNLKNVYFNPKGYQYFIPKVYHSNLIKKVNSTLFHLNKTK